MLTESEIKHVLDALCGYPTVTTPEFADRVEKNYARNEYPVRLSRGYVPRICRSDRKNIKRGFFREGIGYFPLSYRVKCLRRGVQQRRVRNSCKT